MPADSRHYRQVARHALIQRFGAAPTHQQVGEGFSGLRDRLSETFIAVFGAIAIDALFERSRYLTAQEFAWLPDVMPGPSATSLDLAALCRVKTADEALDGIATMLAHDIGLLATLVGDDLVWPLVEKAWGSIGHLPPAES